MRITLNLSNTNRLQFTEAWLPADAGTMGSHSKNPLLPSHHGNNVPYGLISRIHYVWPKCWNKMFACLLLFDEGPSIRPLLLRDSIFSRSAYNIIVIMVLHIEAHSSQQTQTILSMKIRLKSGALSQRVTLVHGLLAAGQFAGKKNRFC